MRILIIEDFIELSYIMKNELEKYGYSVDISNNGEDGEEKAYVNDYDVILLDLILPDKNGIEILKFLRSNKINTPVIVVSARSEENVIIQALNIGADDFIIKPFSYDILNSKIQAVLRRYYGRVTPNVDERFNEFSSVIRVHIAKIRRKLNLVSGKNFLHTQKGVGYYVSSEK